MDDLRGLYGANSLDLKGVFDDSDAELDIPDTLTGAKGIVFKHAEIQEDTEPTEESTEDNKSTEPSAGANAGSTLPGTTYNNTYSPAIYNNVSVPDAKETDEAETTDSANEGAEVTATIENGDGAATYEASAEQGENGKLEITDGANTITININIGSDQGGTDAGESVAVQSDQVQGEAPEQEIETVYVQKNIGVVWN